MRLMGLLLAMLLGTAAAAQEGPTITVRGEGSVAAAPDMATVMLGVTTEAGTAAEALDRNSRAMAAVMEQLRQEGLEERDLQTETLSLSPRFADRPVEGGQPPVVAYVAENTLTVRLRELARLGEIALALGLFEFEFALKVSTFQHIPVECTIDPEGLEAACD